jgi:nucleoside-diphosphate-sugar epimerase
MFEETQKTYSKPIIGGYCPGYVPKNDKNLEQKPMRIASFADFTDLGDLMFIPKVIKVGGIYNLTDGFHPSVSELSHHIAIQFGKKKLVNVPLWVARILAKTGDLLGRKSPFNSNKLHKLTANLTFDDSKARRELGWAPKPVVENSISHD